MRSQHFIAIALMSLLFLPVFTQAQDISARELVDKMMDALDNTRTATYIITQNERMINGQRNKARTNMRIREQPFSVYLKTISPTDGVEILYDGMRFGGKAFINPNGFPYMNVKLSVEGSNVMGDNHSPIYRSGFGFFKDIMKNSIQRTADRFDEVFQLAGSVNFDGKECYKLVIDDPTFEWVSYTVKGDENLLDISNKLDISQYLIMENNEGVDDYWDVYAGQELKIPTSYAKKTILLIEKTNFVPIVQEMHCDKGMYERYEFLNFVHNPNFPSTEFEVEHDAYGF